MAARVRMIPARAAGIMYTRDPGDRKSKTLWITATRGLGLGIASGRNPADFFLVARSAPHAVVERSLVRKEEEVVLQDGGGIATVPVTAGAQDEPSLPDAYLRTLADWGVHIEEHFRAPQDIEWVLDGDGALWIVQSRPLSNADTSRAKARSHPKTEVKMAGGRTVFPGRTSGKAFLIEEMQNIGKAPSGAVVFIRKPSPEIVGILPRIAGLVAEWGNIAGHAATLLREFQIPSVFQMTGAFDRLTSGEPVSLDAVQARVYPGILWPAALKESSILERHREWTADPISTRLLTLNLQDPAADNFRPAGCRSGHDVLRYCHEKAIETMFEVNDRELEQDGAQSYRKLETSLPLNLTVIDLGGGLAVDDPEQRSVKPAQIVSRPFQALWQGLSHPEVRWTREMPGSVGDLGSILAATFAPRGGIMRPLGQESHLLVADEYMNLNSRLAYHYSLVDACLSDSPADNYISFRFEGGGAAHRRRSLRACFLEKCLVHSGFRVDRRADLVNAWFRKAPADQTAERLDLLGRLLASSSQLDMYMNSREMMNWFADQFILGNYAFRQRLINRTAHDLCATRSSYYVSSSRIRTGRRMERIDQAMTVLSLTMGLCLMWEGYACLSAVPKIARPPAQYNDRVRLSGFDTASATAFGGSPINATLTFSDLTPRAGVVVTMTSTDPSTVPVYDLAVPAASKSWRFSIPTRAVSTAKGIRITAGYRGIAKSVVVKIQQFSPAAVGVNPSKAPDGTLR